jgi:predicted phage terminase large subunit-like protein
VTSHASEWLEIEEGLALKRARTSLLGFITYMRPDYVVNWHHRVICKLVEDMIWGDSRRLLISLPPRSGKSTILSEMLPAFLLGINPDEQIISASYAATLAQQFNRMVQRVIVSDEYARVFPHTRLNSKNIVTTAQGNALRNAETFEVVGRKGRYICAGVQGGLTGKGFLWGLADDLISGPEHANSPTMLQKDMEWYNSVFRTRAGKGARIIGTMTRWAMGDIFGILAEASAKGDGVDVYKVVNLPAINEDGPGEYDPRQPGEALWPEFFSLKEMLGYKQRSLKTFQALYQGNPVPPGGSIIMESWWRYYDPAQLPHRFDEIVISWDLSFLGNQGSDYTVGQVWARKDGRAYLLRQYRDKVPFTRQVEAVVALRNAYPECRAVVVEQAANGAALIDALRPYIPNLVPVKPVGSKEARVAAITPIMEAGNVYIPDPRLTPWAQELIIECTRFPAGRFDDSVDALAYGLRRLFPNEAYTGPVRFVSMTRPNPTARL